MKRIPSILFAILMASTTFWACQPVETSPDSTGKMGMARKAKPDKVSVMHKGKVITVSRNSLADHLSHGDYAVADFETFYIRNSNTRPYDPANGIFTRISPPWDTDIILTENPAGDGFTAKTPQGGQKVGYGTNAFDGMKVNDINTVSWSVVSGMSGGIVSYLNMWVTDGVNFAIIASENDYRGQPFGSRQEWKVFEYSGSDLSWLFDSGFLGARDGSQYLTRDGDRVNLSELSDNITIVSPTVPYPSYVGSGAPRGGYGFNLIWGDTQSNFTGGTVPNQLDKLKVTVDGVTYTAVNF